MMPDQLFVLVLWVEFHFDSKHYKLLFLCSPTYRSKNKAVIKALSLIEYFDRFFIVIFKPYDC